MTTYVTHHVPVDLIEYQSIKENVRTFYILKLDKEIKEGDLIFFEETTGPKKYTGRHVMREVVLVQKRSVRRGFIAVGLGMRSTRKKGHRTWS